MTASVGSIVIDRPIEIERLAAIVNRRAVRQSVLLRVNSGVHAETHDFLATAHEEQKFGFTLTDAAVAASRILEVPGLDLRERRRRMSDNPRLALYRADHSARIASRTSASAPVLARVVGKHCESGDVIVDAEYLPGDVAPGVLLAVPETGAYCFSLASNYNCVPRPPVVALRGGEARAIVRGESIDELLARDAGLELRRGSARVAERRR